MTKEWSEKEAASIIQLSSIINSSLDIVDVLENSMHVVEELMDAEASSIFEVDSEKNELYFRLARGESSGDIMEVRLKMGEGIAGWVASSGEPLVIPDTEKDKRFCNKVDSLTKFRTRSIVALPIRYRDRITGVIEVVNKRGPDPFEGDFMEVLSVVASQIGIAIENAKLHERLNDKFTLTRSELKKTQAKLIRSERLAALGQLSQGLAHVVRNPVMSIGGFTRRLGKKLPPDNSLSEYVNLILDETSRLERIVQNVSKLTSLSAPSFQKVCFSDFLKKVVEDWQKHHGMEHVEVQTALLPENPWIYLDTYLMTIAVGNILENAREAVSKGGLISVTSRWEDTRIIISVRDDGRGISPQDLPLVFDPFFTTRTYGSGMGLAIVNRVVADHYGEVKISSAPGEGTEVIICFPPSSGGMQ